MFPKSFSKFDQSASLFIKKIPLIIESMLESISFVFNFCFDVVYRVLVSSFYEVFGNVSIL